MPDFRVRIRLSLDGPGNEATRVRTNIFNAQCGQAGMTPRGTGAYQHDQMPALNLHDLLTGISQLAMLPHQGETVAVDHIWLHVERVVDPTQVDEH